MEIISYWKSLIQPPAQMRVLATLDQVRCGFFSLSVWRTIRVSTTQLWTSHPNWRISIFLSLMKFKWAQGILWVFGGVFLEKAAHGKWKLEVCGLSLVRGQRKKGMRCWSQFSQHICLRYCSTKLNNSVSISVPVVRTPISLLQWEEDRGNSWEFYCYHIKHWAIAINGQLQPKSPIIPVYRYTPWEALQRTCWHLEGLSTSPAK